MHPTLDRTQRGFSLVELMLVVGLTGVLSGIAVVQVGSLRTTLRGDSAMRVVMAQLNQAREQAITHRKYIRIVFDTSAQSISLVREDTPTTTTPLSTVPFEGGAKFVLVSGVPDTPDAFGKPAATSFKSANGTFNSTTTDVATNKVVKFAPDGTLVDWNGRAANGSIFTAVPNQSTSVRAVTILGSTGRVRYFTWNGRAWNGYKWNGTAWIKEV